jgi:hypothetical protein
MPILKLDKDDPQKELEFEVRCALEEPAEQRLQRWFGWNLKMLQFGRERRIKLGLSLEDGYEDTPQVVQRA